MAAPISKELERQILTFVTYALPRVATGTAIREEDLRSYKKIVPDYFQYMKTQTVQSHLELIASNKDDPYFGPYIMKLLTPEGIKWMDKNVPVIIRIALEP
jgi:hypothetical protein